MTMKQREKERLRWKKAALREIKAIGRGFRRDAKKLGKQILSRLGL